MLLSEPFATHTRRCVCTAACNERRVSISGRPTDSHSKLHAQLQRTQLARKRVGSDNDVCCDDAADDSNVPGRDGNRATPCPTKRPRKLDLAGTTAPDARDSSRAIFASRLRCSFTICSALAEAAAERPPTADSAGKSNPSRMACTFRE